MNNNTNSSFSDKWHNNTNLAFQHTLNPESEIYKWILNRNGFKDGEHLKKFLSSKKRILDAGCGNGRVTKLLRNHSNSKLTEVVGIDLNAHDVASENLKDSENTSFYQKNLQDNLTDLGKFDFIYCQEVLHHTGNARNGFKNLCEILDVKGEIAIYVYKKKAPIREYTDDYIRDRIVGFDYEEAMRHSRQLTELAEVLSKLKVKVTIPEVEILGIKEGEYDIQRFIYHYFSKLFWNDEFTFEDNAVINYDWYHPQDCTRHTVEEVREWFIENNIIINHEFVDHYGITVKGIKTLNNKLS
jgi:SAM-dependent methyltransferase